MDRRRPHRRAGPGRADQRGLRRRRKLEPHRSGTPRYRLYGHALRLNRYNAAARDAEQEERARQAQEWEAEKQRDIAAAAEAAKQKREAALEFWRAVPLAPIPMLQQLNTWVIQQNEKRLPKWKFRFAPDLAVQIQPKLTRAYALLFEGKAIMAEAVSVQMFTEPKTLRGIRYWSLSFQLRCREGETAWEFKPTSREHSCGGSHAEIIPLRRVLDMLTPQRFAEFTPDLMLSPHCLCCGKGLTDPVSMARWIGPECWGSASANLPRMFKADAIHQLGETA